MLVIMAINIHTLFAIPSLALSLTLLVARPPRSVRVRAIVVHDMHLEWPETMDHVTLSS